MAVAEQHGGGGDDDEPLRRFGRDHARQGIQPHVGDEGLGHPRPAVPAFGYALRLLFLDFLGGLPEEHVGRDRCAEDAGDDEQEREAELDVRDEGGLEDLSPRLLYDEGGGGVRQQRQGQPLQHPRIGLVGDHHLQQHDQDRGPDGIEDEGCGDRQPGGLGHRADIRADVDGVGDDEQEYEPDQHLPGITVLDRAREAGAGHRADPGAGFLDRDQQGDLVERGPELAVSELRARLGIGGDAGRIVVGGAGDQSRAEALQEAHQSLRPLLIVRLPRLGHRRSP